MDYLKQKTCFEKTCTIIPEFNYKGKPLGLYCYEHKKPDMVYLTTNQKTCFEKTCFEKTCTIIPEFNYKGKPYGIYCYEHKKPDMVYLTNKY
jgi:hypothetical protein